jgi:nucleoside-diphosphate-sugar epimerase
MIVVTGSDGIVGRALCQSMRMQFITFLPNTHRRKLHTAEDALEFDLAATLDPLVPYFERITTIVHLAAAVPHSTAYPDNDNSANKTQCIDANILELQEKTNAHVIYMSTCGLYDRTSTAVKSELSPIKVTTPYFAAKAQGEDLFRSSGNATILRLAAPIGSGIKTNIVLSKFITAARGNKPITIWGSGQREQNYIDTEDVSNLIIKVIQSPGNDILNVASEMPTTMLTLAETVISVLGTGSIKMATAPDPRDSETARYSINKAKQLYGWTSKTILEQSIEKIASEDFDNNV